MCIMNTASYCIDEECNVEDEEALTARLQEQRDILALRIAEMETMTRRLQAKSHRKHMAMKSHDMEAVESMMRSIENVIWIEVSR